MTIWRFHSSPKIIFGAGCADQLGEQLATRSLKRVYIVTDRNLEKAGIVETVTRSIGNSNFEVDIFYGGQAEPEICVADEAIEQAAKFKPDVVVGLGGGSNMDVAKFVACALTYDRPAESFFGIEQVPGPIMPLICIPTTSGTGSEVSHASVLTDTKQQIKISCLSNYTRPLIAIVDPALTYNCPKQVMADSGIDALTHAIEAYIATDHDKLEIPDGQVSPYEGSFPMGDLLAEKAIKLIGKCLVPAVNAPKDKKAKDDLAMAATLAGLAFSNAGVALVHAMEYPLGALLHCSHGGGNGLLLPFVMEFTKAGREEKFANIAQWLGADVAGMSVDQAAQVAIDHIHNLKKEIGVPLRIRDLGGKEDQIEIYTQKAAAIERLMWYTARRPTVDDIRKIYQAAF